ncbi:hypothetical protein ANN_10562 [Periplaneta americana]|uniref:Uncharacterized protein n=1 Tax=Periplaneta americana TaxID=6978 RepID=A0ABQ8TPP5_PERAM|nr:hypothetical protein ANN_10562 [Periplaneta americana]
MRERVNLLQQGFTKEEEEQMRGRFRGGSKEERVQESVVEAAAVEPIVWMKKIFQQHPISLLPYPPYLEAVSSIRNLRTRHAVVIGTHNTFTELPTVLLTEPSVYSQSRLKVVVNTNSIELVSIVRSRSMFAFSSDEIAFNIESFFRTDVTSFGRKLLIYFSHRLIVECYRFFHEFCRLFEWLDPGLSIMSSS